MPSFARWVSIVAHPFVTALVLAGAIELRHGASAAARTVIAVLLLFVAPLAILMVRQVRRGAWGTVDASDPRERPTLFLVGGVAMLALLAYAVTSQPDSQLVRGTVGTLAMLAVCAAATPWIKVSLHVAVASLAAVILMLLGSPVAWLLALVLPVLAWSRVVHGRHQWIEVMLGFAIGAAAGVLIVRLG